MKKWRAGLSLMQRIDWARKGVLGGAELSQADAPVYDAELERHLVEAQPGGRATGGGRSPRVCRHRLPRQGRH